MLAEIDRPRVTEGLRRASEIIEKIELAGVDRAQPLEGAIETLHALKETGAAVAIVTSNSSRTVQRWFDRNRAVSIDAIVGRDTMLGLKPAPDMLIRALELFSVDRSQAAFVGDSEADLLAAQSCGVRFYGIAGRRYRARSVARGRRHGNLRLAGGARDSPEPAGCARLNRSIGAQLQDNRQPCFLR